MTKVNMLRVGGRKCNEASGKYRNLRWERNPRSGELPDTRKESLNSDKFHKHSYLNRDLIISATIQ